MSALRARAGGFTFIELVLVTVVLAILLAATAPRFQATAQRLRLEQAAFDLAQLMRAARAQAVAESQMIAWVWDAAARRARLERVAEDGTVTPLTERGAQSAQVPAGATVTVSQEGRAVACDCVRFGPDGRQEPPAAAATVVEMALQGTAYHIEVDAQTNHAVVAAGPAAR